MKHPLFLFSLLFLTTSCTPPQPPISQLAGQTMGTTYQVTIPFQAVDLSTAQKEVDSLLIALNQSVSTYIPSSIISTINSSTDTAAVHSLDDTFISIYQASQRIYEATDGTFNPAIGPLVQAYGFGSEEPQDLSPSQRDSLLNLVQFESFFLHTTQKTLKKTLSGAQLDFSAIAKGYGVDLVGRYLEDLGINDYFVEIGGEVRTRGLHPENRPWKLGIDVPEENPAPNQRPLQAILPMTDKASATSGNYRNFYVKDGKKYVHTINPTSGLPEISSLLSVTVIAKDCATADAYATAFMVMGMEKAQSFVNQRSDLDAYFITAGENGEFVETFTDGFPQKLEM